MNEVIAKKVKFSIPLLFSLGGLLIVVGVLSLILSILDVDIQFILYSLVAVGGGISCIFLALKQRKVPNNLICAYDDHLLLIQNVVRVPYESIKSVGLKYSDRNVIIYTTQGYVYVVSLVANYKEVKETIIRLIKEKTGRNINTK